MDKLIKEKKKRIQLKNMLFVKKDRYTQTRNGLHIFPIYFIVKFDNNNHLRTSNSLYIYIRSTGLHFLKNPNLTKIVAILPFNINKVYEHTA